jgi:hypothetical protein
MKTVVTDIRIDRVCERSLAERGFEIIKLPMSTALQAPVSAHPDMLMFIGKGKLVCHGSYYNVAKEALDLIAARGGLDIILSSDPWGSEYPSDVLFNAATVGDKLVCRNEARLRGYLICLMPKVL